MPTIPPPPNPPPNGILLSTTTRNYLRSSLKNSVKPLDFQECLWAKEDPEIHRACFFAKVCPKDSPKICVYMNVKPILQVGPTCGLVALSMIFNGRPTSGDLNRESKKLGYTNNGEMFSTRNLLELLKSNLRISNAKARNPESVRAYLYEGSLDSEFIKSKLQDKCMILVPYDADRNHKPCKLNGHKAHWALIMGFLIDNDDNFYVFARQGKSKNLGLFSLTALSESNNNLNEFQQPTWHPDEIFLVPDDGRIDGPMGLKSKSIIIEGLQNEIIKIV